MNKVFLSGCIASRPSLVHREGMTAHLTFSLDVTHRTSRGETRHELYPISLWHSAALWAAQALKLGQRVAVSGYMAKRRTYENGIETQNEVEIAAEEVLIMASFSRDVPDVLCSSVQAEIGVFPQAQSDNGKTVE